MITEARKSQTNVEVIFLPAITLKIAIKYYVIAHIASMSLQMNHLYEAMNSLVQMDKYMKCRFPELAQQKPVDKLWKKLSDSMEKIAPYCFYILDKTTASHVSWRLNIFTSLVLQYTLYM